MKVKCDKFEFKCPYLQEGKEYEVIGEWEKRSVRILDDEGNVTSIALDTPSAHTHSHWKLILGERDSLNFDKVFLYLIHHGKVGDTFNSDLLGITISKFQSFIGVSNKEGEVISRIPIDEDTIDKIKFRQEANFLNTPPSLKRYRVFSVAWSHEHEEGCGELIRCRERDEWANKVIRIVGSIVTVDRIGYCKVISMEPEDLTEEEYMKLPPIGDVIANKEGKVF